VLPALHCKEIYEKEQIRLAERICSFTYIVPVARLATREYISFCGRPWDDASVIGS